MENKVSATIFTALLFIGSVGVAQATPYIYTVNRSFDGGSVIGTITTDTLGSNLGAANFVAWSLNLQRGSDTEVATQNNTTLTLSGLAPAITATLDGLTITMASETDLNSAGASRSSFLIGNDGPSGFYYSLGSGVGDFGDYYQIEAIRLNSGNQAFATNDSVTFIGQNSASVPIPGTWALLVAGLLALWPYLGVRRRSVAKNEQVGGDYLSGRNL